MSSPYTGNPIPSLYPNTNPDNPCFRFTDKDNNSCERQIYNNYFQEQLNLYGQKVGYYVHNYSTTLSGISGADNLYGEHPTQTYSPPKDIIMGINLQENALMLSKYGLLADDEITAFVSISAYYEVFGPGAEPKSGDVFQMTEYGSDRVGGRAGNFYEITQRLDQDIAQINPLAGHYTWLLKAKRFEYSFEPGLSGSAVNQQVYDDTVSSGVSGVTKTYGYNVDTEYAQKVFDYSKTNNNDSVYGGY
jgi:hypothetical protein